MLIDLFLFKIDTIVGICKIKDMEMEMEYTFFLMK